MSFLSGIFSAVHKFFHALGHSDAWQKAISTTLDLIAPLTEEIVAVSAGEPAAQEVKSVITEVQNDLGLVAGLAAAGAGDPTGPMVAKAQDALSRVQSNLSGLLAAGHIKNPDTLSKVTSTANIIIGEVQAMLKHLPTAPAPAAPTA